MAAEDIQVRICLQEIVKLDLEIKACIQDIRTQADSREALEEINTEIRGKLKLRKKIEDLERLANEQDREEDRITLLHDVGNHKQQLTNTVSTLRQSNLSAQLAIDRSEKDQLLNGGTELRKRGGNSKEGLAKVASDITENLMTLNRKIADQVKQSESTKSTLLKSSTTITSTQEEMKSMGGHIKNSQRLITKYSRRQFTDKLLIFLALHVFTTTKNYVSRSFDSDTSQIKTETFALPDYHISSYNEMTSPSSFKTSISFLVNTLSDNIFHTLRAISGSLVTSDYSFYSAFTTIYSSGVVDTYIDSSITVLTFPSLANETSASAFDIPEVSPVSRLLSKTETKEILKHLQPIQVR
ncbi:SEC20 [Mytilus edulis]|uniref:SEC20 n=1 Tax=Mytilus edulis TaxID=6550 RepID=A0A8S3TZX2_MYTED|nr:SEC20 [Mytilus edulis]